MTAPTISSPKPGLFCAIGGEDSVIDDALLSETITKFLDKHGQDREDVLILPPDFTRFHSQAGKITQLIGDYYKAGDEQPSTAASPIKSFKVLPALGTHAPMSSEQIKTMFGPKLASKEDELFLVHDWRNDVVTIGEAPASMVEEATYGLVKGKPWPAQLNKTVWSHKNKSTSFVLSVGQVVPHEVMGMANFNKNLFVGVGGVEAINLSHFIGAVHGMEKVSVHDGSISCLLRSLSATSLRAFIYKNQPSDDGPGE